jgi:hypothetical protein
MSDLFISSFEIKVERNTAQDQPQTYDGLFGFHNHGIDDQGKRKKDNNDRRERISNDFGLNDPFPFHSNQTPGNQTEEQIP